MIEIHALHGFLGLPSDWNVFNLSCLHSYDLAEPAIVPSSDGFWGWAKRFNQIAMPNNGILLGYSLGGRLAMHALLDDPAKWKGGIIVSSHTGFKTEKEKTIRLKSDTAWAERFENEPWEDVIRDWNLQPVFGGFDFPIMRKENQFSRKNLGHLLRNFSRGYQDDLSITIQNFQQPILWICGKLDTNLLAGAKDLNFNHPLSRVEVVEGAAHRVPWEQPKKFFKLIQSFISEVSSCQ